MAAGGIGPALGGAAGGGMGPVAGGAAAGSSAGALEAALAEVSAAAGEVLAAGAELAAAAAEGTAAVAAGIGVGYGAILGGVVGFAIGMWPASTQPPEYDDISGELAKRKAEQEQAEREAQGLGDKATSACQSCAAGGGGSGGGDDDNGGPKGPKKPSARFQDQGKLQDHYNRHGADFGAKSPAEYEQQASDFLAGPRTPGTLEGVRPNGDVVRFNPTTDEFGVLKGDGATIRTYYKPDPLVHGYPSNLDYFHGQF